MILSKMEESLAVMKGAVEEIEKVAGAIHADFYRAHYQACVRLCDLGRQYQSAEADQKEDLKKQMTVLAASLHESLPMLRIHNCN